MMYHFRAAAVCGFIVSAIALAVLASAASQGGDVKPAPPAEPERFQLLRLAASDFLFDTVTGKVYVSTKGPQRKWELLVEAPADLRACRRAMARAAERLLAAFPTKAPPAVSQQPAGG